MARFRNILVSAPPGRVDVSTLRRAAGLAERSGAQLTVLGAVEPIRSWQREVEVGGRVVNVEQMLLADHAAVVREAVARARAAQARVEVRTGKASQEVLRSVVTNGIDLVIVAEPAPEESGSGLSPDLMRLLRTCPVPVWVMRPSRARKLRILALVDPDPGDPIRHGLNSGILDMALSLSRDSDGELHVGHAWEMVGESAFRTSAFVSLPALEVDQMVRATEQQHREKLEELAARKGVGAAGGKVHLVRGDPSVVLAALISRLAVNLVVMGTVARTGLSGWIMGNTAETILRSVACSVLAIKPDGFEPPTIGRRSRKS
jgi:universal stress protein E